MRKFLLIVPCHSIWNVDVNTVEENLGQLPEHWYLAPFQHEGRDHIAFIKHSILAIEQLVQDTEHQLLLFSGSQTKKVAGPISEAQSYYYMARKILLWAASNKKFPRSLEVEHIIINSCQNIINKLNHMKISVDELFTNFISTEEFALDSFENLIYSIYRFQQITKKYPEQITIFGFGFKKKRFLDYHSKAIDFAIDNITYVSIDPVPDYKDSYRLDAYLKDLLLKEEENALKLFRNDWYGVKPPLSTKKRDRNPYFRFPAYNSLFTANNSNQNHKEFYRSNIKGKMPW